MVMMNSIYSLFRFNFQRRYGKSQHQVSRQFYGNLSAQENFTIRSRTERRQESTADHTEHTATGKWYLMVIDTFDGLILMCANTGFFSYLVDTFDKNWAIPKVIRKRERKNTYLTFSSFPDTVDAEQQSRLLPDQDNIAGADRRQVQTVRVDHRR
jgi:hypothetical protein